MLDIGISLGSLLIIPTANSIADAVGWRGTYTTVGLATVRVRGRGRDRVRVANPQP